MAKTTRKCKVCGAEYEYCRTERRIAGIFRWQDVACCEEHGQTYLQRIIASRTPSNVDNANEPSAKIADEVVEPDEIQPEVIPAEVAPVDYDTYEDEDDEDEDDEDFYEYYGDDFDDEDDE